MDFQSADPSIVKSVKQIDLLRTWLRLPHTGGAPLEANYQPDRIEDEKVDLVHYKVAWKDGVARVVIDSNGSRLAVAYGKVGANQGRYLDEFLGPDAAAEILPLYDECIHRARPVYTVSRIDDADGRPVLYERLLLPFSDGAAVTTILASLKTISDDGKFEIRNLFGSADRRPTFLLRAVIDQGGRPRPRSSGGDEIVEL